MTPSLSFQDNLDKLMIKDRIKQLKTRLLGDKDRLEKELEALNPAGASTAPGDQEEQADEVEEMASKFALAQVIGRRLQRVKKALTKMKGGGYGVCEKCGKEIELELLEIDPESRLCRECKRGKAS